MNLLRFSFICILAATISGCGVISKGTSSDNKMLDKAEFATGIDRSQLSIVPDSVTGDLDSVNYKVKTKSGQIYRCYFTSVVAVDSDAICTPIDKSGNVLKNKKGNKGNCNALLKAAGKC